MAYNPDIQYRCTIIRGKSISRMDDYLPIYADILQEICPIAAANYPKAFDDRLSKYITDSKTIKNHRTESVDKILGLVYEFDGIIYLSERTKKYLLDKDQPALFKNVCFHFQQPNGSQKIQTTIDKIKHQIAFKPYHFIISLLQIAQKQGIILTKHEIGYYVLNSLEVLQGKITVSQVLSTIVLDRKSEISKKVSVTKNYAWDYQHINEQFDYLKLANLVRDDGDRIWINTKEKTAIDYFVEDLSKPLFIDYTQYDLTEANIGKKIESEWQLYFGSNRETDSSKFNTLLDSLDTGNTIITDQSHREKSNMVLGDEGENFVLEYEKSLVRAFNPRLVNKVCYLGKIKGLGYDIVSIEAGRNLLNPEFCRYIEVKSTTRVSPPNFTDTMDSINLTRNEWVAAEQHADHFFIYRLYFTNYGTYISIINDPIKKNKEGGLYATPVLYRIEFFDKAVDETITCV